MAKANQDARNQKQPKAKDRKLRQEPGLWPLDENGQYRSQARLPNGEPALTKRRFKYA